MLKLYENIRKFRKDSGLSQEELARRTGYTDRSSIAKIEKGLVDLSESKIKQFAEALGVTPGRLMGWDEKPAEELQGMGALAAEVLMDPATRKMVEEYMSLSAGDQAAVQAMVAALAAKSKKD